MTPAVAVAASPWTWEARPDVWILVVAMAGGYWWSMTRLRPKLPGPPPRPPRATRARFGAGLAVLWIAVDWPLDLLGDDYLFSAHVLQFLMVTMIAAPLLVTGVPTWLQVELLRPIQPLVRRLTRGAVALVLYEAVLVATHLPSVVGLYTSNALFHFALHTSWVVSGCLFWLPVFGSEPVVKPLSLPLKCIYLIGATIVPTVPASFLTWTETAFYDSYASAPRLWGISAVQDLQMAGLLMKLGGGAILWTLVIFMFASWASKETDMRPSTGHRRPGHGVEDESPTSDPARTPT